MNELTNKQTKQTNNCHNNSPATTTPLFSGGALAKMAPQQIIICRQNCGISQAMKSILQKVEIQKGLNGRTALLFVGDELVCF